LIPAVPGWPEPLHIHTVVGVHQDMADENNAPVAAEAKPMETETAVEAAPAAAAEEEEFKEEEKEEEAKGDDDDDDDDDDAPLSKPAPAKKKDSTPKKSPKPVTQGSRASARERKTVERLQLPDSRPVAERAEVKEGTGTKLSEIPNIAFHMSKISGKDDFMAALHRLLFRKPGKGTTRKKAIMEFSGFVYENEEEELQKDVDKLKKWVLADIHKLMELLDMQRGTGSKDEKAERTIQFLKAPEVLNSIDLAQKEADKKEKEKKKRERLAAAKEKKRKQKAKEEAKKKKAAAAKKKSPSKKKKPEPEEEEEEGEEEEGEEEEGEEEPPKKKVKSTPSKSPAKAETLSKPKPKGEFWEELCTTEEQREIAMAAVEIMKTVDVTVFSLKNLMTQMRDQLKKDVTEHKKLVKQVAVDYCREQTMGGEEAE